MLAVGSIRYCLEGERGLEKIEREIYLIKRLYTILIFLTTAALSY